ncbi:MAG: dihydrolipoyl dehydrogenase family protein [Gammaproteobacteria bacterium]
MSRGTDYDFIVIGAGAAGLSAAAGAAQLGARVALIESDRMGGECLNTGCVPSKALLHAARLADDVRNASLSAGLAATLAQPELASVLARVRGVIVAIAPHDSVERMRGLSVEVIAARARFVDPHTVEADGRRLTARRFLIATGSRPAIPPVPGLNGLPMLTNETIFELNEAVPSLLVLGGGPIGTELAQAFRRLDSRVTLVEMAPDILPRSDAEAAAVVRAALVHDGVEILTGVRVEKAGGTAGALWLDWRREDGTGGRIEGSHLLVAAGRRTDFADMNLDAAGVKMEKGRLVLDSRLRTSQKHIYAAGDAAGAGFTHLAEYQARVVLQNAVFHLPVRCKNPLVPAVTYTDPELAEVGLSERAARERGLRHQVWRAGFADVDRAVIEDATEGFVKLVSSPRGRLLGATIVGAAAGELIHEAALAIAAKRKLSSLSGLIHAYPTRAQALRFAADQRLKAALTPKRKRLMQILFRLRGERT